ELQLFAFRVWSYKQGEAVSLLIHLGDRLGLYRALADSGTVTAEDLASATGLHERWVREWLRGNAAAELLRSDDGEHFTLDDAGVALTALAKAYPASRFTGYELSRHALERAERRVADVDLDNVELRLERAEQLPDDGRYGFVLTFDCLHDMTRPDLAIAAIR